MTVDSPQPAVQRLPGRPRADQTTPGARARVLTTADRLFYDEGIRVVGVDRLIAESSVTKATFYKHFGAKDTLVLQFLAVRHERDVETLAAIVASAGDGVDAVRRLVDASATRLQDPRFRGSAYANAAAEFSDPTHPVRIAINEHREWLTDALVELFKSAGHPMPGDAADDFQLALDGAEVGAYAGDAIAASAALRRTAERLLSA
ncbi:MULTISPECIES: TetR/AcrR family transcriptional regulator [unclassified Frigoribacterium]|uniref:TetR/AcrR family transcriptional regulator n=1 Tax=unclassified Frigoribacterium TaxID=2627005 RepID=UPI0006FA4EC2|nr:MULTISPECIES: TetR/AcrR family transcriptional regulator [unclassified Frigoribacterium]KQO84397.1 TetR family transcriptional regulator [Frigoribacterium sp. Leaf263]KQR62442.1 TetR family transcriptional regulator [Frigoribacterium sp. Leaf172]